MRSKLWRIVLSILSAGLAASCQPRSMPTLLEAITDTEPACWLEICPGSTTQTEALNFLHNYDGITISNLDLDHPVNPSISWSAHGESANNGLTSGSLYTDVDDGVVTHVFLAFDNRVSLRDIVSRFGPAPEVAAYAGGTEQIWMRLMLRYPDRGILTSYVDRRWQQHPSDTFRVEPELRVGALQLFAANRVETLHQPLIGAPSMYPYIAWPGWDAEIEVVDLNE